MDKTHTFAANYRDEIVRAIYQHAEIIAGRVVREKTSPRKTRWDQRLDDIVTSRWLGFPLMGLLLTGVLWLTVVGANYPSQLLATILFWGEKQLVELFQFLNFPPWLSGVLVKGTYRSMAWVVSVMLPPMAIFFPCFTLLEDLGYLPRVAFNLDRFFKKAGAHGKQALTMSMGFGCNAAGVTSCRIIDSPRERLIAILTNNFVPCNGRFPLLITLSVIFVGSSLPAHRSWVATAVITLIVLLGITVTFMTSWLLSRTLLKGLPSSFALELPPYRPPQIGKVIVRSVLDRTVLVLGRAVAFAAPAGAITWILANTYIGKYNMISYLAGWLHPYGQSLGLDGYILTAFFLGLPANEIVLPILIMSYTSAGAMVELESLETLRTLLVDHGWTWVTAVSMMLFSLLHFPCSTTLWTIRKETGSWLWTLTAFGLPLVTASLVTFLFNQTVKLLGLF
ncbi:nucleoside recognition domain-containing protein [Calderihabitans maritimus]|uniref:Ferrous iron transport B domain-containing protein n=1 Tax=Calderihabitans maritimus TaxID=1246530 RepID=A0A1Z5HN46_9FIRM|nr:nucleoside recognition domain-containing protein [Calderihabitans maritimus]GAW90939.1 ferrous iron transport B domain-containing protein [Calderihabitans maritimus]